MITLYSGTPGSGKSFHVAKDLYACFDRGGGLILNFPIVVPSKINPKKELRISYWDNSEITPQRLTSYAEKYHDLGVEGQTLLVVDEAQIIWNARSTLSAKSRPDWIKFFSQHRKLGFNVLLVAQNDRMIDRQIRNLIENEVKHRKLNNYGFGGGLLTLFTFGRTWFIAIEKWYGGNGLKLGQTVFPYRSRIASIYDSYKLFEDEDGKNSLYDFGHPHGDPDLRLEVFACNVKRKKNYKKQLSAAEIKVSAAES